MEKYVKHSYQRITFPKKLNCSSLYIRYIYQISLSLTGIFLIITLNCMIFSFGMKLSLHTHTGGKKERKYCLNESHAILDCVIAEHCAIETIITLRLMISIKFI